MNAKLDRITGLASDRVLSDEIGHFWNAFFEDGALADALGKYWSGMIREAMEDANASMSMSGHSSVRVFKDIKRYCIDIYLDEFLDEKEYPRYGSGFTYGGTMVGGKNKKLIRYRIKNPGIAISGDRISIIQNTAEYPTSILIEGVDFVIREDIIIFNDDLLSRGFIESIDGGNNRITKIWIVNASVDRHELYNSFGCLFGTGQKSSTELKQAISCILNLLSNGPTMGNLESALVAAAGGVIALCDETVIKVHNPSLEGIFVETDKNLYKIPDRQGIAERVVAGAKLKKLAAISDVAVVIDTQAKPLWYTKFEAIPSGSLILGTGKDAVLFINEVSDLEIVPAYIAGYSGVYRVSTNIKGKDTDKFLRALSINMVSSEIDNTSILQSSGDSISSCDFFVGSLLKNLILPITINHDGISKDMLEHFDALSSEIYKMAPIFLHLFVFKRKNIEELVDISSSVMEDTGSESYCTWDGGGDTIMSPSDDVIIRYRSRCTD